MLMGDGHLPFLLGWCGPSNMGGVFRGGQGRCMFQIISFIFWNNVILKMGKLSLQSGQALTGGRTLSRSRNLHLNFVTLRPMFFLGSKSKRSRHTGRYMG